LLFFCILREVKYLSYILLSLISLTVLGQKLSTEESGYQKMIEEIKKTSRISTDSALVLSKDLIQLGVENNNTYAVVWGNYFAGYFYEERKSQPMNGLLHYLNAIKQFELYPDNKVTAEVIDITQNTALLYADLGQEDIALDFYFKCLNLSNETKDTAKIIRTKRSIGLTYSSVKDQVNAYKYIEEALELNPYVSLNNQFRTLNTAGEIATNFKDFDVAASYYEQLRQHANQNVKVDTLDAYKNKSFALHNLGELARKQGQFDQAIRFILEANEIKEDYPTAFTSYNLFNANFDLGKSYHGNKELKLALVHYEKALEYVNEFSFESEKKHFSVFQKLAELHAELSDFRKANEYQNKYAEYLSQYLEVQEKSAEENQKLNVELITREYFESVETAETNSTLFWVYVISAGLAFSIASSLWYNAFQKNRLKKRLESQIRKIQNS
jgi:tetratricopeptide (TPR) repeat protein